MNPSFTSAVWLIAIVVLFVAIWRKRRRKGGFGVGPGASGAVYELLSEDKRKAIEIIVEKGAEKRRPEYPDDTVPPDGDDDKATDDHR